MRISELINRLVDLAKVHGDVPVYYEANGGFSSHEVTSVEPIGTDSEAVEIS